METGPISNISGSANIFSTRRGDFGGNPFLQLLIAQMRSQTPLEPVDNASFMTQMSQFSSMEQQKELNDNLLNLLQFQGALARLGRFGLAPLGRVDVGQLVPELGLRSTRFEALGQDPGQLLGPLARLDLAQPPGEGESDASEQGHERGENPDRHTHAATRQ